MAGIPRLEECRPGIRPTGFNVLVAVAPAEEQTKGGVWIPPSAQQKEQLVEVRGRLVDMSPAAFDFASWPEGTKPRIGDAIQFAKLAGIMTKGADGREYRLIDDKSIAAVIDEAAFEPERAAA